LVHAAIGTRGRDEVLQRSMDRRPSIPRDAFDPVPRPKAITLRQVMEHSLTKAELAEYNALSADDALERARTLKTLHLEWQQIGEIANLEPFESVEVLYIQFNQIERIEGLDCMPKLQFLALQGNRIAQVENLLCLKELEFLDLSKNLIQRLDERQLPETVNILNLRENPCTSAEGYRERLLSRLPELAYLDGEELVAQAAEGTSGTEQAMPQEQQLAAGEQGLSAYWKKDELQSGIEATTAERIQAYSVEALADVEDLGRRAEEAADRSRQRRDRMEKENFAKNSLRAGVLAALLKPSTPGNDEFGQEIEAAVETQERYNGDGPG